MTNYGDRATKLPVENSEFLWKLIIDMARTIDLIMANIPNSETEET